MSAIFGRVFEDSAMLTIGDMERRSGLYILGKPRMGKSWLMVNLIAQDIENGHGIFFLDPHGDAIDDLLTLYQLRDRLLFDPEDEEYTFGINPLQCDDFEDSRRRRVGIFSVLRVDRQFGLVVLAITLHLLGGCGPSKQELISIKQENIY